MEQQDLATEFLARFGYPDDYPADDEPLTDREKEDNTTDGDWSSWPDAEELHWMPQDVIEMDYSGISMVSGPSVGFEPAEEHDVVAALGLHGFACRRDDALVKPAYALGFYNTFRATAGPCSASTDVRRVAVLRSDSGRATGRPLHRRLVAEDISTSPSSALIGHAAKRHAYIDKEQKGNEPRIRQVEPALSSARLYSLL